MAQRGTVGTVSLIMATVSAVLLFAFLFGRHGAVPHAVSTSSERINPEAASLRLPAYLHGYRQAQLVCPDGELTGRVSSVVVDPAAAVEGLAGDCTLADMSAANPGVEFYAYVDVGAMRPPVLAQSNFQNTCADPRQEGRQFAVEPENPRVATNEDGLAVYPDYDYLVVADLSQDYVDACVRTIKRLLSTVSVPKTTKGAEPAQFHGVVLDDVAMSPAHGQDISDIGRWGPWVDDSAYGRSMVNAVTLINDGIDSAVGRDVPVRVNLGLNIAEPDQVERALDLARTGAVDRAVREFTVTNGSGMLLGEEHMRRSMRVNQALTKAGMPVIQHDYSTPLLMKRLPHSGLKSETQLEDRCLTNVAEHAAALEQRFEHRRITDHRMLLGHTLLTRTREEQTLTAALSQAPTICQRTGEASMLMAESVTEASIPPGDVEIQEMTRALNEGAYALGSPRTIQGVWHQRLSDGRLVLLNTGEDMKRVIVDGRTYTVPGRSAVLE